MEMFNVGENVAVTRETFLIIVRSLSWHPYKIPIHLHWAL